MWIRNGTLQLGDDTMHYIRFGSGKKMLIMLPGLGDGLTTVKGTALPMALMYRIFARDYTVYMFSRRNHLPQGHTTRDMAGDLKAAMDVLGIEKADLVGRVHGRHDRTAFCSGLPGAPWQAGAGGDVQQAQSHPDRICAGVD